MSGKHAVGGTGMSEKKPMPKCPYCGAEMQLYYEHSVHSDEYVAYRCPKCLTHSPMKMIDYLEPSDKALSDAYIAAMTRWQEPNKVLTLEEVLEIARQNKDGYNHICWIEKVDVRCISTPGFLGGYGIHSEIYVNFEFYEVVTEYPDCVPAEEYGKTWRCWMGNPTAQEMAETPWEGEAGDRHDE